MSRREPKAGEWLRQQIADLGALRNASVRDPQFKAWRQNTLTFIQRIWPGDTTKSERFRRVPFTPPSTKHDARTAREYYERGCGEALEYLNTLLASLGEAQAGPEVLENERHPASFEGDFPEVDLGGAPPAPVGAAPPATLDEPPVDLPAAPSARGEGPPELPASAGRPSELGTSGEFLASAAFLDPEAERPPHLPASGGPAESRAPQAATPPREEPANASRISVRGSASHERPVADATDAPPAAKRVNPLADILGPAREQARKDEDRGGVHVRKDPPREVHREAAKEPPPETYRETPKEAPREVYRETPKEAPREAYRETPKEAPREAPRETPKNGKKKAKTPKPRLKDMLGLSSLEQDAVATPEPPESPPPAEADLTRETPVPDTAPAPAASAPPARLEVEPDREIPVAAEDTPAFAGGVDTAGGWSLPEFMTPHDPAHAAGRIADARPPAETIEPGVVAAAEDLGSPTEPLHEALSEAHVESLPARPVADAPGTPPPPVASEEDPGHAARVTAEFLEKSPVLSSVPRPVTRVPRGARSGIEASHPTAEADDSIASRVLAIAAEVDQLGVPDGHRARARAALMDLARQLDESEVAWDVLRDAVHFVMEFPPLARRTLPLLLPYLDRAA